MMCQGERLESVLRLLALMSVTGGGVPKKHFDALRREVLHTYGHENILTISAMQEAGTRSASAPENITPVHASTQPAAECVDSVYCPRRSLGYRYLKTSEPLYSNPHLIVCMFFDAGLLRKQEGGRSAFAGVKKALRLLVDDVNDMAPTDIAYTFSGYAPLGIRLIEVCSMCESLDMSQGVGLEAERQLAASFLLKSHSICNLQSVRCPSVCRPSCPLHDGPLYRLFNVCMENTNVSGECFASLGVIY